MKELAEVFATFARVGYLKPAPGTWGSLAAVPLFWALHEAAGPFAVVAGIVVVFIVGLWSTGEMTRGALDHDPSEIVIDEVAGQWIALLPISIGAAYMGVDSSKLWPGYLAGFLAFRLFDIWKPLWIGKADARGDALGVMLDDVIAGVFAAVVVVALAALSHGMMRI
ncbi:phosphatidylglycerophosphatase A [Celeribacter sp.]|uniref:phosphatidylglycerophosphatase A family protein n=1 Tax=Celeribacter sp. TaxID=1890673 RepID=UPI003A947C7D